MRRFSPRLGPTAVVLLAGLFVWLSHHELVANLNTVMVDDWGDALQGYYALDYHLRYDSTLSRFEGMNYPFGEQVAFSGVQPLVGNGIKLVSTVVDISRYSWGILHGAILASIVACSLFVFLILRRKGLPDWYAIPSALGIAFLSPQLARMLGHLALSYTFVFPLCWWLILRFDETPSRGRSLTLALALFGIAGLQFYYFVLVGLFLTLRYLIQWWHQKDRRRFAAFAVRQWAVQVLLPFLVLQTWLRATDPIQDRPIPERMVGLWQGVFLPLKYPLGRWMDRVFNIRSVDYESFAYVGFSAFVFTLALLIWGVWRLRRRRSATPAFVGLDSELLTSLAAATVLLLMAFGFPFVGPLEVLREFSGPFRQFRGLARFSWAYFYVINVATFVFLYHWGIHHQRRVRPALVWLLPLAVLGYEAWYYNHRGFYPLARIAEVESDAPQPGWLAAIDPERYQAIVPLPYWHLGGEFLIRLPEYDLMRPAMVTSLLTGLPTTAMYASRTSLSQTMDNLELVQEPYREPALWRHLDVGDPMLLLVQKNETLTSGERWLLETGVPLYEDDTQQLLELDLTHWRQRMRRYLDSTIAEARAVVLAAPPSDVTPPFSRRSYDDTATHRAYRGQGALKGENRQCVVFIGLLPHQRSAEYVLTAWVYLHGGRLLHQRLHYEERSPDGTELQNRSSTVGELLVIRDGDWGLVEFRFTPTRPDARQLLDFVIRRRRLPDPWVDELLIRRASDDVVQSAGEDMFVNGRFYRPLDP